jgi:RNA polymerase sigma factor (sigma-70 family)
MNACYAQPKLSTATLALEQVLTEHGAMLERIACAFESDPSARQDLLQEIGLALWRALPRFQQRGSLAAYVAQVAHHVSVEHVARACNRKLHTELEETLIDPKLAPEQQLAQQQSSERLFAAIQKLPLAHAEVLVLQLEGFAQTEIAEILGVSTNLIGVRANRARDQLKQIMLAPTAANTGTICRGLP